MNLQTSSNNVFKIKPEITKIQNILLNPHLSIPDYQRPYKWTTQHIEQFFIDLFHHQDKEAWRIGTLVIHQHCLNEKIIDDIVDGQQRIITLILIIKAFIYERLETNLFDDNNEIDKKLKKQLLELDKVIFNPIFDNKISQFNIQTNYQLICQHINRPTFGKEQIVFLLNNCELVKVTIDNISEAFQFFDSQNARGRDLVPHDLLKAFHLREFSTQDSVLKEHTVHLWENSNSETLSNLFGEYLYRIKKWINGESARKFTKNDIGLFKGVNLEKSHAYPCVKALQMIHHVVDDYNAHYTRKIDHQSMMYPFQLEQKIINGRRFFEMVSYYQMLLPHLKSTSVMDEVHLTENARNILTTINTYNARHRIGDSYVRTMFNCLLLYYYDKFGIEQISEAIEKIFIWAYSLRLNYQVLQLASMDNYVLENNLFKLLRNSIEPTDFLQFYLPIVEKNYSSKTNSIEELFKKMRYMS
ncbi:DUF262 domain-containing protein [Proteus faecis]|uniref:DUF262 domain-containing protein n=1 Tax=Proteus faecis TaxID=2050967 RepID=UPI000D69A87F|nr:DUF262 domain-containing protein [Proteus faecis]